MDQSAFAALVNIHRKDILSDKQLHHDSLECSGYSSAYSSHDGKDGCRDSVERKINPDSSFDSFGSYGHSRESSLTEENNMPVGSDIRRYGSTSSLNRSGELRLSSNLDTSYDGFNQSTPDLSNVHTRTSSMDSYEDSHGSHSRQSSDSVDIPTRTLKSRRVSQSEDPLKFIKSKPSKDLAKQAIEQITMVQEERHVRKTEVRDEEDWQSVSYFFITVVSPELKPSLLLQCKSDIIREVAYLEGYNSVVLSLGVHNIQWYIVFLDLYIFALWEKV